MSESIKTPITKQWWFWAGVLVLAFGLILAFSRNWKDNQDLDDQLAKAEPADSIHAPIQYLRSTGNAGTQEFNEDLEVFDVKEVQATNGTRSITGKMKSKSGTRYTYQEVNFKLFDEQNEFLGIATASTASQVENGVWTFNAEILFPTAAEYKLGRTAAW